MKSTYRIYGVQMNVDHSIDANAPKVMHYIKEAVAAEADFVLFPEMALTGYHGDFSQSARDDAMVMIQSQCANLGLCALVGVGDKRDGETFNSVFVIDDEGAVIGCHDKIMATDGDRKWCTPGEALRTFKHKGLHFGCLICNDLWVTPGCGPYPDPRLTYQLGQKGAQVVFHAINSGSSAIHIPYYESNLALRAREGSFYIATANAARGEEPVNCRSGVVQPDGTWLTEVDRVGEQTYVAHIEIGSGEDADAGLQ